LFEAGKIFQLVMLIILTAIILYYINKSKSGWVPTIKTIAGLEAIEEAVGRATEMGRPIHYTPGIAPINGAIAAQTFAGLEVLAVTARLVARYGARIIVTLRQPTVLPLAEEVVSQAYIAEGTSESYDPDSVRYLSQEQFAYAAGVMGTMVREKVAANIMLGGFWAESLIMAEAASDIGAIQIAGTARLTQIPFFVVACDYVLIGEELFAASAIASGNPIKLGSIAGQDIGKLIAVALILVGSILESAGIGFLSQIVSK
jgi:hypothetical protein